MLLSAIPPTVAHSIALLAGDTGRSYTTDFLRNGEQSADNPDFTVCIIRCVYRAELILRRYLTYRIRNAVLEYQFIKGTFMSHECTRDQYIQRTNAHGHGYFTSSEDARISFGLTLFLRGRLCVGLVET